MSPPGQKESGFCFLRDQEPLSPAEFERALALRAKVRALIEGRRDFLQRTGRDPAIHLPHGNWELGRGLYSNYQTVSGGDYDVLNHLRLFSEVFTGYSLLTLSRDQGNPLTTAIPADADQRIAERAAQADGYVERYRQATRYLPELLHISPPNRFGEVGWLVRGKIVNHDTVVYLERLMLLAESGKLWELRNRGADEPAPRILEIGVGFGGLAYHLKGLLPRARYFCVDLPESLLFSSIYLGTLFGQDDNRIITPDSLAALRLDSPGFTFLPNYLFDDCVSAGLEFDLILNTLSMSEMVPAQVRYYAAGIARLLGPEGVFFEQNQDNRRLGWIDARQVLAECLPFCLPLGKRGRRLSQGVPHLWAARPVAPYAWIDSREYLAQLYSAAAPSLPMRRRIRVLRRS